MLVLAEQMHPPVATRLESLPPTLDALLRQHLRGESCGRLEILDDEDHRLGQVLVSRGHVAWVHCNTHPEPLYQRIASDIGMSPEELGNLIRSYPADKLNLMQVMASNAPLGPVDLQEILFEHNAAHLHELMRSSKHPHVEFTEEHLPLAEPYAFDVDELLANGESTASGDAIARMWDTLTTHDAVEHTWILEEEVPSDLHTQWPWLQDGLEGLRGTAHASEWFGLVGETMFLLLAEGPFVLVAALKPGAEDRLEDVLTALTRSRNCLIGLALLRVVQKMSRKHPGGLIAASLIHEQGQRMATWQRPSLADVLLGEGDDGASMGTQLFHELGAEALGEGGEKGVRRTNAYDLHYRARGGLSALLLTDSGSTISF